MSDFPRITIERMREVMAKRDVWASTALNARFNYNSGRGRGSCSCCGESKVCADWLPAYQVCSTCFNAALPKSEQWRRVMSEDENAAVRFYRENPSAALLDFQKRDRTPGVQGRDENEVIALVYLYGSHCAEHPEDHAGQQERLAAVKAALGVETSAQAQEKKRG